MAEVAKGQVILSNGYDLSCYLQSFDESANTDTPDTTALCSNGAKTFAPGLTERNLSGEAFWNASKTVEAENIDALFKKALGSQNGFHKLTYGKIGATLGAPAQLYNADQTKGGAKLKVGDLIMVNFDAKVSAKNSLNGYAEGVWLGLTNLAGDGTPFQSLGYDNGAAAVGYRLRLHNVGGAPTITWQLDHSTNGTTWVAVTNSAAMGAIGANEVLEISPASGTIFRYVRIILNTTEGASRVGVAYVHGF